MSGGQPDPFLEEYASDGGGFLLVTRVRQCSLAALLLV